VTQEDKPGRGSGVVASGDHGPLAGCIVLELGQLIAGPFAGQLLGDLGAEVIKVELPGSGDPMRQWGRLTEDGRSLWWSVIGRNKKSVALDVRLAAGRAALLRLVADADVVIENFRPGTMERWGLSYEELREVNPGIVLVRVSGFGQWGPYAHRAGFGAIAEAMGGLRAIVGEPDRPSVRTGIAIGDQMAGVLAALGAVSALMERTRSGQGQEIDVALHESVLAFMDSLVSDFQVDGWIRRRTGPTLAGVAPSNVYPTRDGREILIAGNQDSVFARLAEAMGQPGLADDPRFCSHRARGEHQAEIDIIVAAWTATHDADELEKILADAGVPAGGVYRAPEMLADEHFRARGSIVEVTDETGRGIAMQNVAPRVGRTPGQVRWPGPTLGAHDTEILVDRLGLSPHEVSAAKGRPSS
jgi:crotonobetainyl-CoA:carnitine CoA-transferase CaiB-like acyl-CoA transferase